MQINESHLECQLHGQILITVDKGQHQSSFCSKCIETTQQIDNHQTTLHVNNKPQISLVLINQVKQVQECCAIAFNNTGTIMVAGFRSNIKVWKFNDGMISQLAELKGQSDLITCLIYSRKNQWFVSGDQFGQLQLWKQGLSDKEWMASNIQKGKGNHILTMCVILNQKENQLIASSLQSIIVSEVNYEKNYLQYQYTLESRHSKWIYGLSLNNSETALISCGEDKKIVLWYKGAGNQWKYQCSVDMFTALYRICFISENEFVAQLCGRGYTLVFRLEDQQLKEQENLQIEFKVKNGPDSFYFPTIYNKKNDIIIQKSYRYVYIIRRENNGQFKVQADPIDCEHDSNYGGMSEDGQHLTIWNIETKEFRIYKLSYK